MNLNKKLAVCGAFCAMVAFPFSTTVLADQTTVNVSVTQSSPGTINWNQGKDSDIVAIGISRPDSRGMAMAREAAIMAAQRNLIGIAQGMQITSDTTMRDLVLESDVVNRKITGALRGAQIVEENSTPDGGYYVKMRVPLYGATGSIAAAITPTLVSGAPQPFASVGQTTLSAADVQAAQSGAYTGVVVDCSGLGLEPTFSPVIYDADGRAVYGIENLQYDAIITEGMVGYTKAESSAEGSRRAGTNPLTVKAVAVRGGDNSVNKVNAVVSVEDADRILLANQSSRMLERCAVVFVR